MPQIYRAHWRLMNTRLTIRAQFNSTSIWAERCGLVLLDIQDWRTETYLAIMGGDLHGIFTFLTNVGYKAEKMELIKSNKLKGATKWQ